MSLLGYVVKLSYELIRPALIYRFCDMKQLGVFLLPPGWDASPSQGYPPAFKGLLPASGFFYH